MQGSYRSIVVNVQPSVWPSKRGRRFVGQRLRKNLIFTIFRLTLLINQFFTETLQII